MNNTINQLDKFYEKFKKVAESHMNHAGGRRIDIVEWNEFDFDVRKIMAQLEKADTIELYSIVKKAYEVIRVYHRAYKIYSQTRDDYYNYASYEAKKDVLILDRIVKNIQTVYDELYRRRHG